MPEMTERATYDASERNGRYLPIQISPEDDTIQIRTDGERSGENTEPIIRCSNGNVIKPNRYGSLPHTGNFWG